MRKFYYLSLFLFCSVCSFAQQQDIPVPKPHQLKWHEAELGAVFHYDLHVFDGIRYGQGNNRINPIEDYNIFLTDCVQRTEAVSWATRFFLISAGSV